MDGSTGIVNGRLGRSSSTRQLGILIAHLLWFPLPPTNFLPFPRYRLCQYPRFLFSPVSQGGCFVSYFSCLAFTLCVWDLKGKNSHRDEHCIVAFALAQDWVSFFFPLSIFLRHIYYFLFNRFSVISHFFLYLAPSTCLSLGILSSFNVAHFLPDGLPLLSG
jgi:hypothetical protein